MYSHRIKYDMVIAMGCIFFIVLAIALIYWLAFIVSPNLFPVTPSSDTLLFICVILSSIVGCLSGLIGLAMNSKLMIGRQVLAVGIIATPLNIILSYKLFPVLGPPGVVIATVVAQFVTVGINLLSMRTSKAIIA